MSISDTFQDKANKCNNAIEAQNWPLVVAQAERLVRSFPDKPHGHIWLFQAHWHLGDEEYAHMLAQGAALRFPDKPWVWTARARLAGQKQGGMRAAQLWQECIEHFPNLVEAYTEGARAYLHSGDVEKAQQLTSLGLKTSPNNVLLEITQAEIYESRSDWQKANEQWEAIKTEFPENAEAHRRNANTLHRLQDHVGALKVMISWIKSGNGARRNDYDAAVQSLILGFSNLDPESQMTFDIFKVLMLQPLDPKNRSAVSELTRAVQSLSVKNNPRYQPVTDYIKEKFWGEICMKGSTARLFALRVGIQGLKLSHEEIDALISGCSQDRFCRYFSGYPLHQTNVLALKAYIAGCQETELLDGLSDDGLKNLHLFATAENEIHLSPYKGISHRTDVPRSSERTYAPPLNKDRLRIAVCVSGQLRGFKSAFNSWKTLGLDNQDTHFFVHSWRNIGRKSPDLANATRSFSGRFLYEFQRAFIAYGHEHVYAEFPALFAFYKTSDIADRDEVAQLYRTENVILEDDTTEPFASYTNPMKMYCKIQKSWEMARDSGLDFDLVLRIRPDKTLITKPVVDWAEIHKICTSSPTILTDRPLRLNPHARLFVGDQFAVSTPDLMAIYCEIFSNRANEYGETRKRADFSDPHKKLAFTLYEAGLTTSQNPYFTQSRLIDSEKLETTAILALIKEDIEKRQKTALDQKFVSALEEDLSGTSVH